MHNFEISVNDLKDNKVKGVKIPDTLDKQVYNVQYGNTIELPISGIPNSSVVLTVLGKAEELTLVMEDGSEVKPSQDGSINKSVKLEQTDPKPAEHTESPSSPAPAEHTGSETNVPAGEPSSSEQTDPKASETGSETNDGRVPEPSVLEGDHL